MLNTTTCFPVLYKRLRVMVTGRFAPWTFRPLDVSPLHWKFCPLDVSPLGRFIPQNVSPLDVSPPGRFTHSLDLSPPTVDVLLPSAFLCVCCFSEHWDGTWQTGGQTELLSISRISVVTCDKNENENYYRTFSANENRKILATILCH